MPLSVTAISREAACTVVHLRGEHDISTVAELSETMARAIGLDDADVVVDLSEVEFMGAVAVGVIVRAEAFLRARSRALSVRSPSRVARRVIDVCGLAALIDSDPLEQRSAGRATSALATWVAVPSNLAAGHIAAPPRLRREV